MRIVGDNYENDSLETHARQIHLNLVTGLNVNVFVSGYDGSYRQYAGTFGPSLPGGKIEELGFESVVAT